MAETYTKETALYDTGKINTDITTAKTTATSYITDIGQDGIKVHPSGDTQNYSQINSNGMKVYKSGNEVASFGAGIQMYDNNQNEIFSVASANGAVTTFVPWGYIVPTEAAFSEVVNLGRIMQSFTNIVITYTVGSTVKTQTFTSLPIEYESTELYVDISALSDTTLDFYIHSFDKTNVIFNNAVINFVTTQTTSEMTLGSFPEDSMSGALKIGNGTSVSNKSNAFAVDWAGNGYFGGNDIRVKCNNDSTGGASLYKGVRIDDAYSYVSDTHDIHIFLVQVGRLVNLDIMITKSTSTAVGTNLFTGTLYTYSSSTADAVLVDIPYPELGYATGCGFYSRSTILGFLNRNDDLNRVGLTVRNEGPDTLAAGVPVHVIMTYIAEYPLEERE